MKHHHVPQFLLRSWAAERDGKVQVFHLDIPRVPSSRLNPEYTGYEDDLYAFDQPQVFGLERQALEEDHFRHVDDRAAVVLQGMMDTGLACLTKEDLGYWHFFLMLFRLRNPDAVSDLSVKGSSHLRASLETQPEEYQKIAKSSDPTNFTEWTEENFPGLIENFGKLYLAKITRQLLHTDELKSMLCWLCDFGDQANHLLLADRPCIFTHGLAHPDLTIVLPIGPRKAYIAAKTERIAHLLQRQRSKSLMSQINESSLAQAKKYIWALDNTPRRFICKRLRSRKLAESAPST